MLSGSGQPADVPQVCTLGRQQIAGDHEPAVGAPDSIVNRKAMGAVEEARADLADETNLNARLVLERLFLRLAELDRAPVA